ncbi:MAG: hypothetical protein QMD46_09670 [Methanomicrobiales archaeon]|nr:hypothetical protein [Methanomicrobiales archaeon]
MEGRRCPNCGSDRVIPIRYGMPSCRMCEEEQKGRLILGGCMPHRNNCHCKACGHEWADTGQ